MAKFSLHVKYKAGYFYYKEFYIPPLLQQAGPALASPDTAAVNRVMCEEKKSIKCIAKG